jgi:hypothetical protein
LAFGQPKSFGQSLTSFLTPKRIASANFTQEEIGQLYGWPAVETGQK